MKVTVTGLATVTCFRGSCNRGEELEMVYFRRLCSILGGLAAIPTG